MGFKGTKFQVHTGIHRDFFLLIKRNEAIRPSPPEHSRADRQRRNGSPGWLPFPILIFGEQINDLSSFVPFTRFA